MKRIFLKIVLVTALIVSFGSCEDFFTIDRPQETQWTTTATFEQGLNAAYRQIQWGEIGRGWCLFYDFAPSGTALKTSLGTAGGDGDIFYFRRFGERIGLNNWWRGGYRTITLANLALDLDRNSDGNPFGLDKNSTDYIHNYSRQVAECYFVRAYAYLTLIKMYAPPYVHNGDNSIRTIPLKTTAAYSKEDVLAEGLGTKEEVYQQIISDLKEAKRLLPEQFTLNSWNNFPGYEAGRANKWVAAALLGKVYFLMGKYDEAKAEFTDVINSGKYGFDADPKELYNKPFPEVFPKGSIYEFNGGDINGQYEQRNNYIYPGMIMGLRFRDSQGDDLENNATTNKGTMKSTWNAFCLSYMAVKDMGWMVDPQNGDYTLTAEALADKRYQQVYHLLLPMPAGTEGNNIPKGSPGYLEYESYPDHAHFTTPHIYIDKFFRGEDPYGRYTKFPLIKFADMYLLRGWINWKKGLLPDAADDLNKVWNASNPTNPDRHTAANITHESIWGEYLREMTGDGWTTDFIMGTQMDAPAGDDSRTPVIKAPYANWYHPIPADEEALNNNYK